MSVPRYRFGDFILSPRRRLLVRDGRELPLIPRYFDLLVFLVERRHEAVHRREIFDRVWSDVIVSDSALSQAIRTIRRTLGDDSREPLFVRTVSRHGYRFVFDVVVEEEDDGPWLDQGRGVPPSQTLASDPAAEDVFEPLLARLMSAADEEEQREAAERLHALGTSEALARLASRSGHARARALLRDARWVVPGAGPVPVIGVPGALAVIRELIVLRLRGAVRMMAVRCAGATLGGMVAGLAAGLIGGLLLAAAPGSTAPIAVAPVLGVVGAGCAALAAAGVAAGLCLAEAAVRSRRVLVLTCGGALGGGASGAVAQWLGRWTLAALVGLHVPVHGAIEGLVIGSAAGLGYAWATLYAAEGLAAPSGRRRVRAALVSAAACGLAALVLALLGRPLVGGTVNAIAHAAQGSQVALAPLGRWIGEPDFGRVTQTIIATCEGALFGTGLMLGLTRRPRRL